ncbi:MAG: Ribosomal protein large subunit ribosomal protein [Candidatus Parcubacteria bacterium]|jgi:large subunit ribosomal protein L3
MKFIIAKKLEMSQRFKENGNVVPVTLLQAGDCVVTQIRTKEKDGYDAVQIGCIEEAHPNLPEKGHTKALGKAFQVLKEFRLDAPTTLKVGDVVSTSQFIAGEFVDAVGVSKGKGFQGVVKRHHFRGGPRTHGHKDNLRMPGSIGSGGMQRVFKGLRMGGRMGGDQVTVKNLEVVEVDAEQGILAVKGAVPGAFGATILLTGGHTEKKSWN